MIQDNETSGVPEASQRDRSALPARIRILHIVRACRSCALAMVSNPSRADIIRLVDAVRMLGAGVCVATLEGCGKHGRGGLRAISQPGHQLRVDRLLISTSHVAMKMVMMAITALFVRNRMMVALKCDR